MKVIFAGTPRVALPALQHLLDSSHTVVAVLTRPDAPVGRKRTLQASPVKAFAQAEGIPVLEATRLRGEIITELAGLGADAVAVVAYGAIAGPKALATTTHGWFNLHFSLLPHWRGAAPVQRAMAAGHRDSGLTVFQIDPGLDTGPIITQKALAMPAGDAGEVLEFYAQAGAPLLGAALDQIELGAATFTPQEGTPSHAPGFSRADAELDFHRSAIDVANLAQALSPQPGPWAESTTAGQVKLAGITLAHDAPSRPVGTLFVHAQQAYIATADGAVFVRGLQPFGKPMQDATDVVRGRGELLLGTTTIHVGGDEA